MLITCTSCNAKIRGPESAAGKRVKCPKCKTIITVPMPDSAEAPSSESAEETAPVSEPTSESTASEPESPSEPAETRKEEPETPDEAQSSEGSASFSKKPPPLKLSSSTPSRDKDGDVDDVDEVDEEYDKAKKKSRDDGDEDDGPPRKKRSRDDEDDESDDDEDGPRKKKRSDDDEDDDDDDLDVRKKRKRNGQGQNAGGMALASMILGIVSVVFGLTGCVGCCCAFPALVSLACGVVAVILAHMDKSPGADAFRMTGMICGYVGIGLSLIGFGMFIFRIFFPLAMQGLNFL